MTTSGNEPGTAGADPRARGPSPGTGHQQEHDAGERLHEAGEEVRREAERAGAGAEGLTEEAKARAGRLFEEAKDRARSAVDERKEGLAKDVGDIAHALRASAGDLEEHDKAYVARYVEQAAGGVERIADTLHRQNLGDFVRQTEDFARRQPGLFIGGAVAAGFALARFLKSSGERRATEEHEGDGSGGDARPMPGSGAASHAPTDRTPGTEDPAHGRF